MKEMSKIIASGILIVLMLSFISVTGVFAMGTGNVDQKLEAAWKKELSTLERYQFLDNQIAKWIKEWLQTPRSFHSKRTKNRYTTEARMVLQRAEALAVTHPGFDAKGRVINSVQAAQSVQNLETYLRQLRLVFLHKFQHRQHKH